MTLPELIARLEKAKGPDAELGRDILLACGWRRGCVGHFYGPLYQWTSPDLTISFSDDQFHWHNPTALIDAAMNLVPADLYWIMAKGRVRPSEPMYGIQVLRPTKPDVRRIIAEAEHENLEICILIAALRARSAQEAGG